MTETKGVVEDISPKPKSEQKPKRKFTDHDIAHAIISDHPFEPRGEWYTLCKHCALAQAAHAETTIDWRDHMGYGGDHADDD